MYPRTFFGALWLFSFDAPHIAADLPKNLVGCSTLFQFEHDQIPILGLGIQVDRTYFCRVLPTDLDQARFDFVQIRWSSNADRRARRQREGRRKLASSWREPHPLVPI